MNLEPFVNWLASQGVLGVILVFVGWFAWTKDREANTERQARINDAKDYNALALKLQSQGIDLVNKLSDILEEVKKITPNNRFGGR